MLTKFTDFKKSWGTELSKERKPSLFFSKVPRLSFKFPYCEAGGNTEIENVLLRIRRVGADIDLLNNIKAALIQQIEEALCKRFTAAILTRSKFCPFSGAEDEQE